MQSFYPYLVKIKNYLIALQFTQMF